MRNFAEMFTIRRSIASVAAIVLTAFSLTLNAQSPGLGGYGGSSSMSSNTSPALPYSGGFNGFMPDRMGGGLSLSFTSKPTTMGGKSRGSFRLSNPGGMGRRALLPSNSKMTEGRSSVPSMSVTPPNFGYPFRVPPSLLDSGSGSSSTSM